LKYSYVTLLPDITVEHPGTDYVQWTNQQRINREISGDNASITDTAYDYRNVPVFVWL